jgi:hypothetical protein
MQFFFYFRLMNITLLPIIFLSIHVLARQKETDGTVLFIKFNNLAYIVTDIERILLHGLYVINR